MVNDHALIAARVPRFVLFFSLIVCACDGRPATAVPAHEVQSKGRACDAWLATDGGTSLFPECGGCFDRGAASCVLSSPSPAKCRQENGPSGPFHVKTVFAPDGTVKSAEFDQDAEVGRTPRGQCLLDQFRALHIPPFNGGPVSVGRMIHFE